MSPNGDRTAGNTAPCYNELTRLPIFLARKVRTRCGAKPIVVIVQTKGTQGAVLHRVLVCTGDRRCRSSGPVLGMKDATKHFRIQNRQSWHMAA